MTILIVKHLQDEIYFQIILIIEKKDTYKQVFKRKSLQKDIINDVTSSCHSAIVTLSDCLCVLRCSPLPPGKVKMGLFVFSAPLTL